MNMDLEFLLIQLLGFIPSIVAFTALQSGSRKRILALQCLCCILWVAHYALLGEGTAVIVNFVGLARAIVCAFNDRKWASGKFWLAFFLLCYAVSPALSWDGLYSLLLAAAMMLTTFALWGHNMRMTRLLYLLNSPLILVYNLFARSYSSAIIEVFALISFIIAVWRFDIRPNHKEKQNLFSGGINHESEQVSGRFP